MLFCQLSGGVGWKELHIPRRTSRILHLRAFQNLHAEYVIKVIQTVKAFINVIELYFEVNRYVVDLKV